MKYFQMFRLLVQTFVSEELPRIGASFLVLLSLLGTACSGKSNPAQGSASGTAVAEVSPIGNKSKEQGGLDTSGGNVSNQYLKTLPPKEIRYMIESFGFVDAEHFPVFSAAIQGVDHLRANFEYGQKRPIDLDYKRYSGTERFDAHSNGEQEYFQINMNQLSGLLRAIAYGTEALPDRLEDLIKANKLRISILAEGSCWDSHAKEARDASISKEGVICYSLERLSKKLNAENAERELNAITMHEICHLYGCNEQQAQDVQDFFLKFPGLQNNKLRTVFFTWGESGSAEAYLQQAIADFSEHGADTELCGNLFESYTHSEAMRSKLARDTATFFLPMNQLLGNLSEHLAVARGFCMHRKDLYYQIPFGDRDRLAEEFIKINELLRELYVMGKDFEEGFSKSGPNGDWAPGTERIFTTEEFAKVKDIRFPAERAIEPEKIKCTININSPTSGEQVIPFYADKRQDFAALKTAVCTDQKFRWDWIRPLGKDYETNNLCEIPNAELEQEAREMGHFRTEGRVSFKVGDKKVYSKFRAKFKGGKTTGEPNLEIIDFDFFDPILEGGTSSEAASSPFRYELEKSLHGWSFGGSMDTDTNINWGHISHRGFLVKGTANTTSTAFYYRADSGISVKVRMECSLGDSAIH